MRIVAWIVVGGATNAARIQDRWAVGQLDEMPLVAVSAQNYAGLHSTQSLLDRRQNSLEQVGRPTPPRRDTDCRWSAYRGRRECHALCWRKSVGLQARNDDFWLSCEYAYLSAAPIEVRSGPDTQRSWLPRMIGSSEAMSRSQTSRGQSGPDTQSPKLMVRSTWRRAISMSTASSAGRFPWISAMTAIRIPMLLDVGVTGRKLVLKPATMPLAD